jgi:hypothetical protein
MSRILPVLRYVLARLDEPSTWAGMAGLFAAAGMSDQLSHQVSVVGVTVAGVVAMLFQDTPKA